MNIKNDPNLALCVALTGPRGSGKSLLMTALAAAYAEQGYPLWSNLPISFDLKDKHYESQPLDMSMLYSFAKELRGGLVLIDEINLWANSRKAMANANILLAGIFQMIRKRSLTLGTTFRFRCSNPAGESITIFW